MKLVVKFLGTFELRFLRKQEQQNFHQKFHGSFHGDFRAASGENFTAALLEREEETPAPKTSALLRKQPVLLRANFVLAKDRKQSYYGHFCGKMHREGSCSKAAGGP